MVLRSPTFTDPSLTSVYQPGYQLGATAARLLMQRVDGLRSAPKKVLLPTELKKRNSVGPPHAAVAGWLGATHACRQTQWPRPNVPPRSSRLGLYFG